MHEIELFLSIANFPNLKVLRLSKVNLSNQALRNLFTNENLKNLKKLNLKGGYLAKVLTADLCDCRVTFKDIKNVLLGDTCLNAESIKTFTEIFSSASLDNLNLANNS